MAILQAPMLFYSRRPPCFCCCRRIIRATVGVPENQMNHRLVLPEILSNGLVEEFGIRTCYTSIAATTDLEKDSRFIINLDTPKRRSPNAPAAMVAEKLYAIMEVVADRVEMHKNVGDQRDNWNHLLLTSINVITLAAAMMAGIAATNANGAPFVALKVSSAILYAAATGVLMVMNNIQPSQLGEEQRNAARLFKQLHGEIQTIMTLQNPTTIDVDEAMEKVLALDRAYPLPLLGAMLEKFPKTVEPTVWWPPQRRRQVKKRLGKAMDRNGWDGKLEEEMRKIGSILKRKDEADYLRLGKMALGVSRILAISGPSLTAVAALGSAFVGTTPAPWPVMLAVIAGGLSSIINTLAHGGQIGMVFEMYRNNAGFFRLMQETMESNIHEEDVGRRENGEVLRLKVALQLGRSLSDLEHLAALDPSGNGDAAEEFASKLF